jgi:hypothetical protein
MGGDSWKLVKRADVLVRRTGFPVLACSLLMLVLPVGAAAQESAETTEMTEAARAQGAIHEVRRGDTLWDLAGSYLGSPFLWPRIFESNTQVIEDPHWIYPGEILSMPGAAVADASAVEQLETWDAAQEQQAVPFSEPQGREGVSGFGGSSLFDTSPEAGNVIGRLDVEEWGDPVLVSESDFYRAPLLVRTDELPYFGRTGRKLGGNPLSLRVPDGIKVHDVVIIDLETLDVVSGDELRAIRWEAGRNGRKVARSVALLEVLTTEEETARARVLILFDHYKVGDLVILAEGFDVSETLQQAVEVDGYTTVVAGGEVDQPVMGEGDMIFFESGLQDGVRIGDEFILFDPRDDETVLDEDHMATARVVRVTPETSTARIVDLRDTSPGRGSIARRTLRGIEN